MKQLSVIIPCYENPEVIRKFLPKITDAIENHDQVEVIFVDAFANEDAREYIEKLKVKYIVAGRALRSTQCNMGAEFASAPSLFFLHIDSIPPQGFDVLISNAFAKKHEAGCFRLKFDCRSQFLAAFAWFSRYKWSITRGGDQGLFILRNVFEAIGKYRDDYQIMEDVDIARKLLKRRKFHILAHPILTSCRKYHQNGILRLQWLFTRITAMYWLGISNDKIFTFYKKHIH